MDTNEKIRNSHAGKAGIPRRGYENSRIRFPYVRAIQNLHIACPNGTPMKKVSDTVWFFLHPLSFFIHFTCFLGVDRGGECKGGVYRGGGYYSSLECVVVFIPLFQPHDRCVCLHPRPREYLSLSALMPRQYS